MRRIPLCLAYSKKISTQERIRSEILATIAGFGEKILTMTSREILIDSWETAFDKLLPNELEELLVENDEFLDDYLDVVPLKK